MNSQDIELWLYKIRLWTGLGLIVLLAIQITTGYILAYKIPILFDYVTEYKIHTQFSWVLIYFFLTHATVNLRFLFRKWWPSRQRYTIPALVAAYVLLVLGTLYIQFFR